MMIHFAGIGIRIGNLVRQRCSWCGELIEDFDLSLIMVRLKEDGSPGEGPRPWAEGALVSVEKRGGGVTQKVVVGHVGDESIPAGTCAQKDIQGLLPALKDGVSAPEIR
jgi:hypothetical protein